MNKYKQEVEEIIRKKQKLLDEGVSNKEFQTFLDDEDELDEKNEQQERKRKLPQN